MFQSLTDRLSGVLDKLTKRGALSESDVNEAIPIVGPHGAGVDVKIDVEAWDQELRVPTGELEAAARSRDEDGL